MNFLSLDSSQEMEAEISLVELIQTAKGMSLVV